MEMAVVAAAVATAATVAAVAAVAAPGATGAAMWAMARLLVVIVMELLIVIFWLFIYDGKRSLSLMGGFLCVAKPISKCVCDFCVGTIGER